MSASLPTEMFDHYRGIDEKGRLDAGAGELERVRTQRLIGEHLPQRASTILDVGGAAGVHALWLARQGHKVHLIDPVPHHIDQARKASAVQNDHPLTSSAIGDARDLAFADAAIDAVLMLGPLYHLTERADRLRALSEAHRVLRPGGLLFVAGISRFASFLSAMTFGLLSDDDFVAIVRRDLKDGQHRNPTKNPQYFTTTFFHHPDELKAEVEEAGFRLEKLAAVEGPVMWMRYFDEDWQDAQRRSILLELLHASEEDPAFVGISSHFMAIGCK